MLVQSQQKNILNRAYGADIEQIINNIMSDTNANTDTLVFPPGVLFDVGIDSDCEFILKRPYEEVIKAIDSIPTNIKHLWFADTKRDDYVDWDGVIWRSQLPYYVNLLPEIQAKELLEKIGSERFERITCTMTQPFTMFNQKCSELFMESLKQKEIVFSCSDIWCSRSFGERDVVEIFRKLSFNENLVSLTVVGDTLEELEQIVVNLDHMRFTFYVSHASKFYNMKIPPKNIRLVEMDNKKHLEFNPYKNN